MMTTLYRTVLGPSLDKLPEPVQHLHDTTDTHVFQGRAGVSRGPGILSRLTGWLFRFPPANPDLPVIVTLSRHEAPRYSGRECWQRQFGDHRFESWQFAGAGRNTGLLMERFGPVTVGIHLSVGDGRLRLTVMRWSLLGLPLPMALGPTGITWEGADGDRFRFHVEIASRLTGLIIRYEGWLRPEPSQAASGAA